MSTKLETLQEKLAKLQEQVVKEELKVKEDAAIVVVRDSFSTAIMAAVAATEQETGKSLREIGLGIWIAYPDGDGDGDNGKVSVSALAVGTDGLPKALKRTNGKSNGDGNGNGHTNGTSEYFLKDGRGPFAGTLEALDAMEFKGDRGKYYHRHDRLPKELQEQIEKRPKAEATEPEATEPEATATE